MTDLSEARDREMATGTLVEMSLQSGANNQSAWIIRRDRRGGARCLMNAIIVHSAVYTIIQLQ